MSPAMYFPLLFAILAVGAVVTTRPRSLERGVDRAARECGLGVPPEVRPLVMRRIRRERWGAIAGGVVALAVGWATVGQDAPIRSYLVQLMLVVLGGVGSAIGAAVAGAAVRGSGRRVARTRVTRVRDYISPVERFGVLLAALAAAAIACVPVVAGAASAGTEPGLLVGAAPLVLWALFELGARRIVARPQPAETAVQLAWDDAARASAIRGLASATAGAAGFALVLTVFLGAPTLLPSDAAHDVQLATLGGVLGTLLLVRMGSLAIRPSRYFLGRLWPDTVPYVPEGARS